MTVHATLHGTITDTGGENCDERGFEWGYSSGNYPYSWTETGNFGTGSFSHTITGLPEGSVVYFRAKAHNSAGWGYGDEKSFVTPLSRAKRIEFDIRNLTEREIQILFNSLSELFLFLIIQFSNIGRIISSFVSKYVITVYGILEKELIILYSLKSIVIKVLIFLSSNLTLIVKSLQGLYRIFQRIVISLQLIYLSSGLVCIRFITTFLIEKIFTTILTSKYFIKTIFHRTLVIMYTLIKSVFVTISLKYKFLILLYRFLTAIHNLRISLLNVLTFQNLLRVLKFQKFILRYILSKITFRVLKLRFSIAVEKIYRALIMEYQMFKVYLTLIINIIRKIGRFILTNK